MLLSSALIAQCWLCFHTAFDTDEQSSHSSKKPSHLGIGCRAGDCAKISKIMWNTTVHSHDVVMFLMKVGPQTPEFVPFSWYANKMQPTKLSKLLRVYQELHVLDSVRINRVAETNESISSSRHLWEDIALAYCRL